MTQNAFINKTKPPTNAELAAALGAAKPIWDELLTTVAQECDATVREWKCYSPKSGWAMRVKRKERTVVWLSRSVSQFTVFFILGDRSTGVELIPR